MPDACRLSLLVQRSVALLRANRPADGRPYLGAFSGGKDSVVIKELARMAEVPVEWHYHDTTIDPPELVRFVREVHPDVVRDRPKHGPLLLRAEKKGIPSRFARWCCDEYKEGAIPETRPLILGIRIAESRGRAEHWTNCVMPHFRSGAPVVLPARLWSDDDVWGFIRWRGVPYCKLYDEGFARLGCVGCPLPTAEQRRAQFARWPGFERRWRLLFERLWAKRAGTPDSNGNEWFGSRNFDTPEQYFEWWTDGQPNVTSWRIRHGLAIKSLPPERPVDEGDLL